MKKICLFCAAAALLFASCNKQESPAGTNDVPESTTVGFQTVKAVAPATKTTANGVNVLWTENDVIGLYCGVNGATTSATFTTSAVTPSASAEFAKSDENVPVKIGDYYYAAYPYSGINQWYYSTNAGGAYRLYFSFLKEQTAVKNGWDATHGAMAAKSMDNNLSFEHYSAYIKFTVGASSPAFKSVTVTTKDGTNIVDRLRIDLPDMTYSANNLAALRSPSVKLSTADGNAFETGTYYISIIPRQYPQGFEFSFENAAGDLATVSKAGDFTFEGGDVADLGTIGALNFVGAPDPLELATVYEENGVKQGIVYYVDPDNQCKGMIVSASNRTPMVWATQAVINELMDANGNAGTGCGADLNQSSLENYDAVVSSSKYSAANYPAIAYCKSLRDTYGGNWRLPSVEEYAVLFNGYYGKAYNTKLTAGANSGGTDYRTDSDAITAKNKFDAALSQIEGSGASLDGLSNDSLGTWYWLDEEAKVSGSTKAQNAYAARFGMYYYKNYIKTTEYYVRCIRDVENK